MKTKKESLKNIPAKEEVPAKKAASVKKTPPAKLPDSNSDIADDNLNQKQLLEVLRAVKKGDFSVRMSDDKTGLDNLDFGSLVHDVLQKMGEDRKLWACQDAGKLGGILGEIAGQICVERYGSPLPLPVEISLMAMKERLYAAAKAQTGLANEGWEIIEVEKGTSRLAPTFWPMRFPCPVTTSLTTRGRRRTSWSTRTEC